MSCKHLMTPFGLNFDAEPAVRQFMGDDKLRSGHSGVGAARCRRTAPP